MTKRQWQYGIHYNKRVHAMSSFHSQHIIACDIIFQVIYLFSGCYCVACTMHPLPSVTLHHAANMQDSSLPGDHLSGLTVAASAMRIRVIG